MLERSGYIVKLAAMAIFGSMITTSACAASVVASWGGDKFSLTSRPGRAELQLFENVNPLALADQAKSRRFTLVLRGLSVDADPHIGYFIFLNFDEGTKPCKEDAGYVGAINFFGMPRTSDGAGRSVSFEVSSVLVRLQQTGRLNGPLSVTFVPTGSLADESRPIVASISLYED
jgi:hypothetical protein